MIWTGVAGPSMPNWVAALDGLSRTYTWVLGMPCTGTKVGEGVGGMGVGVIEGTTVGARVEVMMNGVEVWAPGNAPPNPQPESRNGKTARSKVLLCTR